MKNMLLPKPQKSWNKLDPYQKTLTFIPIQQERKIGSYYPFPEEIQNMELASELVHYLTDCQILSLVRESLHKHCLEAWKESAYLTYIDKEKNFINTLQQKITKEEESPEAKIKRASTLVKKMQQATTPEQWQAYCEKAKEIFNELTENK